MIKKEILYREEKYNIIVITFFIFGYTLTNLSKMLPNLSIVFLFLSIITSIVVYKKIGNKLFWEFEDSLVLIFIMGILVSGLLQKTEFEDIRNVILGSLIPYYLGRTINFNKMKNLNIFEKTTIILGVILLSNLYFSYFFISSNKYRLSVGDASTIALGEIIGLFSIVNYFKFIKTKDKKKLFLFLVGLIANFLILSSRSSAFLIVISLLIASFIKSKNKKTIIIYSGILLLLYFVCFNKNSFLIEEFPQLKRFSLEGMLNDPSVVGYKGALGRKIKEGRIYNLNIALTEFNKSVFLGTGIGRNYAHNIFIEILGALGLIGFINFLIFILKIIRRVVREKNILIIALFFYFFLYRQFSFALNAHKTLFFICGALITKQQYRKNKKIQKNHYEVQY